MERLLAAAATSHRGISAASHPNIGACSRLSGPLGNSRIEMTTNKACTAAPCRQSNKVGAFGHGQHVGRSPWRVRRSGETHQQVTRRRHAPAAARRDDADAPQLTPDDPAVVLMKPTKAQRGHGPWHPGRRSRLPCDRVPQIHRGVSEQRGWGDPLWRPAPPALFTPEGLRQGFLMNTTRGHRYTKERLPGALREK